MCVCQVEATAPVTLAVGPRPHSCHKLIHFPEHLRFANLPVDFTIRLEVYVMVSTVFRVGLEIVCCFQRLREPKDETCASVLANKARNLLVPR